MFLLTGTIPRQLGNMTSLTHLGLENNELRGEFSSGSLGRTG